MLLLVVSQGTNPLTQERLEEAVRVIISYQNRDGGMATYENTRSFHALEVGAMLAKGGGGVKSTGTWGRGYAKCADTCMSAV